MAARPQSIFLLMSLLPGMVCGCLGSHGPSWTALPRGGLGGIPQHLLYSTQPFWGFRVRTCAPLPAGQTHTCSSGTGEEPKCQGPFGTET